MKPLISLLFLASLAPFATAQDLSMPADSPALSPDAQADKGSPAAGAIALFRQGRHQQALETARPLAEEGDPDALFLLAFASETGQGTDASRDNALQFYRLAAEKGHLEANYRRALILLNSEDAGDRDDARKALESAVEEDPANAGRMLGEAWLRGLLSDKPDRAKAIEWWTKSSEAGDTSSLILLARLHDGQFGFADQIDEKKAIDSYCQAADQGNVAAYLPLGSRLLNGSEEIRDEEEGRAWLDKAIDEGLTVAHLALGDFEENIREDIDAAIEDYSAGAEAGQPDCMLRLAAIRFSDRAGEPDPEKGREWLAKAAEAGNAEAHYQLAGLISREEEPDRLAMYGHLVGAARGGIAMAQNELGLLYLSGQLGGADAPAAAAWFTRAAKANHPAACYNLATLYERGIGVDANINNAGDLYSRALKQGHAGAATALARLYAAGIGTEADPVRGWALATLAVERGDDQAKQILGELSPTLTPELLTEAKKLLATMKGTAEAEGREEGDGDEDGEADEEGEGAE